MGEVCCFDCMRFFVLFLNVLFWMLGMIIIFLGILTVTSPNNFVYEFVVNYLLPQNSSESAAHWLKDFESEITLTAYVLIAVGGITLLLSFLGCAGAYRHSQCLLGTYVFLLVMIVLLEVAGGVFLYLQGKDLLSGAVYKKMIVEYDEHKREVDLLQKTYRCCGANGPYDWTTESETSLLTRENTAPGWRSCPGRNSFDPPGCLNVLLPRLKESRGFLFLGASLATLFSLEIFCVFMAIGVCCILFNTVVEDFE